MNALNRKFIRDLWHLRGQILAVTLVVACGVATYITMRGAYHSILLAQAGYYTEYHFADVFAQLKRAPESLATEIARIEGVSAVQTRVAFDVTLDVPRLAEPATGKLLSIPEKRVSILNDIHILRGRYVEPGQRNEVLVSEGFADANELSIGQFIGAIINGKWERLQIVGVAISPEYVNEVQAATIFPDKKRFAILWMSREAIAPTLGMEGAFNDVSLTLESGASEQDVIAKLNRLLEPYGGFDAYGREEQVSHRFLSDEIKQDRITGLFIPSIFLGVAAFLINIVLARLVSTQRSQIAVLKAFGYGNLGIGIHYLLFGLVAVLIGAALGTGLGMWLGAGLAELYKKFFHFPALPFVVQVDAITTAVLMCSGAAVIGAITSVRRVVQLPPAESMRPEPPGQFRAGLLDRMGLQRLFSPATRMIARNLERTPTKALLSVIGIAFAVAILIVGRYSLDALDYIIELQFRTIQREDVAVNFNTPRSLSARTELLRLNGVLYSEPFRTVAARLRFEHRSKRIAILGLVTDGKLRNLLDKSRQPVELPPNGIVLSEKLAEILAVRAGDVITLDVLEGQRPSRQVMVAKLVDELVGISAYMDLQALNRLLREGDTISGAFLAVDPLHTNALYTKLKQMPSVAGVAIREVMVSSFLDTIAENIGISITILIIFAGVIAFAVVYNSARIALSERGHELASLRVLGFTRQEVGVMLLGEQAILTLLAVPCGFLIGYEICAALTKAFESEVYRMPLVISNHTYAFAFLIVLIAAFLSGLLVLLRLNKLDIVEVLKSRE